MAFEPTITQQQAINTKGNILVSAAAGSGKTAVLVERVIKKLCDRQNPTRADELLIVTFTNAAAAEMRSRIEKRLDEECKKHPEDINLLLQKNLLNNAKICTIDSFCIDLVRENFDKLGVSPDFKIGEETDLNAINESVIYSIINRYFEEKKPVFLNLLDVIGSEFDERNFVDFIFSLYNFSRQLPFPKKWYKMILESYSCGIFNKENLWYKYSFSKAQKITSNMLKTIDIAIENISTVEKATDAYLPAFLNAKEKIERLYEIATEGEWDGFYNALYSYELIKLPVVRGLGEFGLVNCAKETYKYLNGKVLEPLFKFFYNNFSFINNQFKKLYPSIVLLISILTEFEEKVFEEYCEQNVFTFHNTEHLALELLCKEDGEIRISDNAKEILNQYSEVMVDEYQDTNDLQDLLFHILSDYDKKLFVVGDVKQSIYAFRGANPENFLKKKQAYVSLDSAIDNMSQKIILGNNFRSKDQICNFVNFFFGLFMQEETGNIIYDEEERLVSSAKFPSISEKAVSFDIVDCLDAHTNSNILEARSIAEFIEKTINGEPCVKQDDSTLRKAKYGDFAILLRGVTNKAPTLVTELEARGIPVNINVNNFVDSIEISTFLSLIQVLDNPKNDIALATVMLSPIFGFSTDEMAKIRTQSRYGDLYTAVIFAAENGNTRTKEFLSKIEYYRLKAVTTPLPRLIMTLLVETEYLNLVTAMRDGNRRRNNLLLLCDLAANFNTEKNNSLKAFCEYVIKFSSTGAASGDGDSVKIMSIHASKGLQFPICIISSTASRFNDSESRNSYAYSTKYGLGFKYYDEEDSQKYSTISREVILDDIKNTSLEEELRLLYVAMTRAQDKLHFVASYSNFEKSLNTYCDLLMSSDCKIDNTLFLRTNCYADWLLLSILLHPENNLIEKCNGIIPVSNDSEVALRVINGASLEKTIQAPTENSAKANSVFVDTLKENFSYKYPFSQLCDIQSKISVSVLVNMAESEKFAFTAKPDFMNKDGVSSAGRGTAMHKVIEFFDFSSSDCIEDEIERLYEWQFISLAEKESLDISALEKFFKSDIFGRIKASDKVEREMRFLSEIPACEIRDNLNDDIKNEKITVQGAVDVCFVEDEELVILDFKTDRVDDAEELAKSYGEQLNAYAKACEKIFGLKVKEKLIYSFAKSQLVKIK